MSRKVLLWGMGNDYELLLNLIKFEILKENMSVEAIVCRDIDRYCKNKDGFVVITKREIINYEFDYLLVTSSQFFWEIKREAIEIGIEEWRIINCSVFRLPLFDFSRYVSLIENPVTILSDDCWGGYTYHRLGLPFNSPLINILWDRDEYAKFIEKPLFYLNTNLQMVREGNFDRGLCPVGKIGTPTDYVTMNFVHNTDFAEAMAQWNRRKDRVNSNNLFIKMGFSANLDEKKIDKYLHTFNTVQYKKVLFYNVLKNNLPIKGQILTNRFIWRQKSGSRVEYFNYCDYLREEYPWDIDILRLLNGEDEFSRYN